MSTKKYTIATIFMVPTLGIIIGEIEKNGFINAYIRDENRDVQYENAIYLLFKPQNINRFRKFLEKEYERTENIIEDYDYNNGLTVAVYQLNPLYEEDFNLVKQGKYSKTSPSFQLLFPKIKKIIRAGLHKDELSLQFRIFNKTPDMYDYWEDKFGVTFSDEMEVWEGYKKEKEILTKEMIEQYV